MENEKEKAQMSHLDKSITTALAIARIEVKRELKENGIKISDIKQSDISAAACSLLIGLLERMRASYAKSA